MVFPNMAEERSKPLHNFVLPSLKWGNQRHLRCMKLDSNGDLDRRRPSGSNHDETYLYLRKRKKFEKSPPPPESSRSKKTKRDDPYDGIESLRAKLLLDLRVAAENMKFPIGDEKEEDDEAALGDDAARPCNLRTRRAACRAPPVEIAKLDDDDDDDDRQERREQGQGRSQLKGSGEMAAEAAAGRDVEKERRKFSISLGRDEIKDDLLMMTGKKPARRPKKRAKIIQNQLDNLFPGLWFTEVTTESYRVPDEAVEAKKGKKK